jgi:glycine/D-amino acid oxidase-like deaminating enzyme
MRTVERLGLPKVGAHAMVAVRQDSQIWSCPGSTIPPPMPHTRILGAGISGLSCALALRKLGHEVRIVAAEFGERTVSSVAGALWLPYLCAPEARTNPWAKSTYSWLEGLAARTPEAGVDMIECIETVLDGSRQPWLEALPAHVVAEYLPTSLVHPTLGSWRFRVPAPISGCSCRGSAAGSSGWASCSRRGA